jgi:hypothetical protein
MFIPPDVASDRIERVIAMRAMKLMAGDVAAMREARLMSSIRSSTASLIAGASGDQIINR